MENYQTTRKRIEDACANLRRVSMSYSFLDLVGQMAYKAYKGRGQR